MQKVSYKCEAKLKYVISLTELLSIATTRLWEKLLIYSGQSKSNIIYLTKLWTTMINYFTAEPMHKWKAQTVVFIIIIISANKNKVQSVELAWLAFIWPRNFLAELHKFRNFIKQDKCNNELENGIVCW